MNHVALVDSGLCNLDSARRALEECGATVEVITDPDGLGGQDRLVLPGVGSFDDAMRRLRESGMDAAITEYAGQGFPVLGVCLGMQLLASTGEEGGHTAGLDLIEGEVVRMDAENGERLPHIGWNEVWADNGGSPLLDGITDGADFYFVHSYRFRCADPADAAASTPYGGGFCSVVSHGLVHGVQFHPEKSQRHGFELLQNFLAI